MAQIPFQTLALSVADIPDTLVCRYPGMQEVRDVPGKDGIAFVEFEDEMQATVAMNGLQGFKVQQL